MIHGRVGAAHSQGDQSTFNSTMTTGASLRQARMSAHRRHANIIVPGKLAGSELNDLPSLGYRDAR